MVSGIYGQRSHVYPVSELTQSRQRGSFTGRQPHKNPPPHPPKIPCAILSRRSALMGLSMNRFSSDPCDLIGFSSAEVDGRESLCTSPWREILVCATMAPLWTRHRDPGKGKWREGSSAEGRCNRNFSFRRRPFFWGESTQGPQSWQNSS